MDRSPRNNKEGKQGKKHFQWWHLLIILGIAGTHLLVLGLSYDMAFIGGLCFADFPEKCPLVPDWYSTVSGLGMILLLILDFPLGYMISL